MRRLYVVEEFYSTEFKIRLALAYCDGVVHNTYVKSAIWRCKHCDDCIQLYTHVNVYNL